MFPFLGLALSPLSGMGLPRATSRGREARYRAVAPAPIAGGNVAAALCSASLSSIIGIVLTPLLAGMLLHSDGELSVNGIEPIAVHLLLPFVAGQMLQAPLDGWMRRHEKLVKMIDRVSVLLMVYGVISAATVSGVWSRLPASSFLVLVLIDGALLVMMMMFSITGFAARRFGLSREDEIAIAFCGSKKSLVTGIPMANVLFPDVSLGLVVLPLMIFHQLQLMACATLAQRHAASGARLTSASVTIPS